MTLTTNNSPKFRAALQKELPLWIERGLISQENANRISDEYQLSDVYGESSKRLSTVIFTIGGIFVGGGIISFVAAGWVAISDPMKLVLLFSVLIGLHVIGYWLWHSRGWARLGRALIFCGCLVFGANIGLVAQIFHVRGDWYGAFGAWALGSFAMAWAIESTSIGLLAIATSFIWFAGFHTDSYANSNVNSSLSVLYPLALAALSAPLAWGKRSQVLYATTAVAVVISVAFISGHGLSGTTHILLALTAGALAMWTGGHLHKLTGPRPEFAGILIGLGLTLLGFTAYIWSFRGVWDLSDQTRVTTVWLIFFLVFGVAGAIWVLRRANENDRRFVLGGLVAASVLSLCAIASISGFRVRPFLFAMIANAAALAIAAVVIGMSLVTEKRALFWSGTLYTVLLILSRFLEYETSLLLKSVAFLACGAALIYAGVRYERYIRSNDPLRAIPSSSPMSYD